MSSRALALVLVFSGLLMIASTDKASAQPSDNDLIAKFAKDYAAAFAAENVDAILNLVTDDFVALTPDKPPLKGKDRIRKEIESDFESMQILELQFTHQEIVVAGDWAHAWGTSKAMIQMEGEEVAIRGKYLWILRRHPDGFWKLARDSASGNGPPETSSE